MAAALLLASCTSSATTSTTGTGTASDGTGDVFTTIEFTFFGDPVEAAGYADLVEAFEMANPDVDVIATPVAEKSDLLARLLTRFAAGSPPDVFLVNYREYGQFAAAGSLADVQPLLDTDPSLDEQDFFRPPMDAFRFDGRSLTCMPQNVSSLVAYVNRELFEEAGLVVPEDGWTWEEFVAAATAMTRPEEETWGLVTSPDLIRLAPFVWSAGGRLVDDPFEPGRLLLDDPATSAAIDDFLDLSLVHGVVPPDRDERALDGEARFLAGRAGIYLNSRKSTPTLREGADFDWDVVPLPTAPGGTPRTILHADAYCLAAGGDVETAWRLTSFAMSEEGQRIVAATGRTVPSRRDVAGGEAFLDPVAPPRNARVFLDNAEIADATPVVESWAEFEGVADDLLAEVWFGRLPREEGLGRLAEEAERLLGGS